MLNRNMIILIIGLMGVGSINAFITVTCYGSDGHIAVELLGHNHCMCPQTSEAGHVDKSAGGVETFAICHEHCRDTTVSSTLFIVAKKNVRFFAHNTVTASSILQSISNSSLSCTGNSSFGGDTLTSFFVPLRTVILLT